MIKVRMIPFLDEFNSEGGVKRVVEAYHKYSGKFGVKYVGMDERADIVASHFGATGKNVDVAHLHGLIWGDGLSDGDLRINKNIADACRGAREVTVPSEWVAMTLKRDMRLSPTVIPHGIEFDEWQDDVSHDGYVLWNKNRVDNVCNPDAVNILAKKFTGVKFLTTFSRGTPTPNVNVLGKIVPHSVMRGMIQRTMVYLSTSKETFGIGVLEAMASGVPVLGWDFGGNRDLVAHGETGYLARPYDYDDLSNGLEYCMKHHDVLGDNGRYVASRYTWENVMKLVADVYKRASTNHGREYYL